MTRPMPLPAAPAWSTADPYAEALRTGRGPLYLSCPDGRLLPLDVERWCAQPDPADRTVLAACGSHVLDVGCGPGRMVTALAARGRIVLGIDVNADAVRRTHADGGSALVRSVFDRVPREGHWRTALLMDGNIGIGGDPGALLTRLRHLLRPGGTLIVETTAGPPDRDERLLVRLHDGSRAHGPHFPWAVLGRDALERHASAAGWTMSASWTRAGRAFTSLHTPGAPR
ncbi:methyltransferase domain-containing protein [Streptomyces sp. NRRL S-813]|uniref:methyltransferase domain-containing protein n=1 Tax=Streptomyces sp. NRRL S-813 TaxID=1463919 RepID=UPI002D21EC57|nr:methyltransferase domain-containing protein [Streptomyces sp. NRRL S-813]